MPQPYLHLCVEDVDAAWKRAVDVSGAADLMAFPSGGDDQAEQLSLVAPRASTCWAQLREDA